LKKNPSQTEKTEPSRSKPENPSQTGLNWFCSKKTKTGWFKPVLIFVLKKFDLVI